MAGHLLAADALAARVPGARPGGGLWRGCSKSLGHEIFASIEVEAMTGWVSEGRELLYNLQEALKGAFGGKTILHHQRHCFTASQERSPECNCRISALTPGHVEIPRWWNWSATLVKAMCISKLDLHHVEEH